MSYRPPDGPRADPPPAPGHAARSRTVAVLTGVAVLAVIAAVVSVIAFSGGDTISGQASTRRISSSPGSSSAPPSASGSVPASRAHTCGAIPADGVDAPSLATTGVLVAVLGKRTLTTPVHRYTTTSSAGVLKSYCYDNVAQSDLGLVLSFLDGAGYRASPGKIPDQQQILRTTNTLTPKLVAISVTGTLKIDERDYDSNTGSVEVDWQD